MNNNVIRLYIKFIELHFNISNSGGSNIPKSFFDFEKALFYKSQLEIFSFIKSNSYSNFFNQFKYLVKQLNVEMCDYQGNLHAFRLAFSRWVQIDKIIDFELDFGNTNLKSINLIRIKNPTFEFIQFALTKSSILNRPKAKKKKNTLKTNRKTKKRKEKRINNSNSYFKILYTGMIN